MSASLIGGLGSSAFRLSTSAMSMSLTGSCFSSESFCLDVIGENEHFGRGSSTTPQLIARKIVDLTRIVGASPDYLASHGRPIRPSDIRGAARLISAAIRMPMQGRVVVIEAIIKSVHAVRW